MTAGRLNGKVAIVTGAGNGIGEATAKLFASEGARVVCVDLDGPGVEATVNEIRALGGEAIWAQEDVSTEDGTLAMTEMATQAYGTVDILHNNAGIAGTFAPAHEFPVEIWDKVIAVNLRSVFLGCRAVIPTMLDSGSGVIVNTASTFATFASHNFPAYHAAKGGVVALTKQLAFDYGPTIRINCVSPGTVETGALRDAIASAPDPERRAEHYRNSNPVLKRIGDPMEIAHGVLFLASDESSFMFGHDLVMGAGQGLAASPVG